MKQQPNTPTTTITPTFIHTHKYISHVYFNLVECFRYRIQVRRVIVREREVKMRSDYLKKLSIKMSTWQ